MEIHAITLVDGVYHIEYKRTIKDLDGNDVVVSGGVEEKTRADIDSELTNWQAQLGNCNYQIERLNAIIAQLPTV